MIYNDVFVTLQERHALPIGSDETLQAMAAALDTFSNAAIAPASVAAQ